MTVKTNSGGELSDQLRRGNLEYKSLLRRYILHVIQMAGDDFVSDPTKYQDGDWISHRDYVALKKLSDEANE